LLHPDRLALQCHPVDSRSQTNRKWIVSTRLVAVAAMWAFVGCAPSGMRTISSTPPFVAIRYEHRLAAGAAPIDAASLRQDFAQLTSLGFVAIWLDSGFPDRDEAAAEAAAAAGLTTIRSDERIDAYVEFGRLTPDAATPDALATVSRVAAAQIGGRPSILAMPPFLPDTVAGRAQALAAALQRLQPPQEMLLVGFDGDCGVASGTSNAIVATWPEPDEPPVGTLPAPTRQILLLTCESHSDSSPARAIAMQQDYYRGLAQGRTDGILVWRYRSWPGESNGIADATGHVSPAIAGATRTITKHAREWGPLLAGSRRIDAPGVELVSERLRCAVLQRKQRVVILVYNEDAERFARGTLRIPGTIDAVAVTRLVAQDTGQRHPRRGDALTIPLRLGPAEAILFEAH
ncbi:MAG: hypothetical protein JXA69_09275, partial [Phycisphaerae bacterium]|nr:hypothetical protein [Phycisphaerae bacterium]